MSIINSYGLFWDANSVYWGSPGQKAGSLQGVAASAKKSVKIDFRDQIGIYVLYQDHQMIYVGQAGAKNAKLFARLKKHRTDYLAHRWNRFSWFGLRRVLKNGALSTETLKAKATVAGALNHIEAVLISASEPSLNKQGGRFGRNNKRFLQVRDERLGPTDEEMLRELWQKSKESE